MHDAKAFYDGLRSVTGSLSQEQVRTVEGIMAAAAYWHTGWLAYGLATAWHEARLIPQAEWGKGEGRPYGKPGKYGQPQYGRGLVQLTWDRNYEKADRELNLHGKLLADFDLALDPDIAAKILVYGMEDGWFTGKDLSDYITGEIGTPEEFCAARRIINGTDKAAKIAEYAGLFQDAVLAGGWA